VLGKRKSTPCCQVVYARQYGWMHRLTQPKLFGSDHGLRFISGPQIRAPCSLNLIFRRDRKELFVGGLGICLLNSSIHRTMADDTLLIELTGIPHVIALVCGVFLRPRVRGRSCSLLPASCPSNSNLWLHSGESSF
jgi:hypothetical protein